MLPEELFDPERAGGGALLPELFDPERAGGCVLLPEFFDPERGGTYRGVDLPPLPPLEPDDDGKELLREIGRARPDELNEAIVLSKQSSTAALS